VRYRIPTVSLIRLAYYVPNFVSIGLFCRPLAAKFLPVFGLRYFVVSPCSWRQSEKVEHGAQTQTFPYPTASKSFLCSNAFMATSGAQSLTFKSVTNKQTNIQTNRQKTQRFWPPRRRVKSEPHQAWHGDRGPRARSCASKTFGVRCIVLPLGGAENLGEPDPSTKTP